MTIHIPDFLPPANRRVFCNRTLNMRGVSVIGFDMDYTLIHYRQEIWEERAYEHLKLRLYKECNWPVTTLKFDPQFVTLGLILDLHLGNIVKANRFGYIKRAFHGTKPLSFEQMRGHYAREIVDLSEPRWVFLNTLFSLSEATMYAQLVDMLDANELPQQNYSELYRMVKSHLDFAHMEGQLKAEIVHDPERFVVLDEELPQCLLDLKHAGKKLVLITNSEWEYAKPMMEYAFNRFLPQGTSWRDLFDLCIVLARKPEFFTHRNSIFEMINDQGHLRPHLGALKKGGTYVGGNARLIEKHFNVKGEEILYVGDHIFADVHVSKSLLRWRTALILRELEDEVTAIENFKDKQLQLSEWMKEKADLEQAYVHCRLYLQRLEHHDAAKPSLSLADIQHRMQQLRQHLNALDQKIIPLAQAYAELLNKHWGLLTRTGNDKSHLARQIEQHADIYTSRVSNLLYETPFFYLRSPRGSLPHDSGFVGGVEE